jgi:uncharacterized repeat protein (TIGR02543 family)
MQNKIQRKGIMIGLLLLYFSASVAPVLKADPITWNAQLTCTNAGGQRDYVVLGEAPDAHDGPPPDTNDVVKPPAPMPPYIRVWLDDNLPIPYDNLWEDYRFYPAVSKVWNLTVQWWPSSGSSPTNITMTWDPTEVHDSEYTSVTLCENNETPLQDMLLNGSYMFSCPAYIPQNFKIICSNITNKPPYTPNTPNPMNDSTDESVTTDLSWSGGDPDPGDTVTYDVYFGMSSSPPKVVGNQSGLSYDPGTMDYQTTYYWKIVAWDNHGAFAVGPLWSFTTRTPKEYTLTITTVGSGLVTKNPDQIVYYYGDVIQLTAFADIGWTFNKWSGDLIGSNNPVNITIDGNKSVTATFTQNEYTLIIATEGSGSVVKNPDQAIYHYNDVVQLSAFADIGWTFNKWSGDLIGSNNPVNITIDGNKSVTAIFTSSLASIANEYPVNASFSVERPPVYLQALVNDSKARTMNILIRWENHQGTWVTLSSFTSVGNGTYNYLPSGNDWIWGNTIYIWSVNVSNGVGWTNETYHYITNGSRYDVNNNNEVNFQDAGLVWTHRTSLIPYDGLYDVNGNGQVNFQDAGLTWIHRD